MDGTNQPVKIFLVSNPMIVSKPQPQEECVFCLDEVPPLKKNDKCNCQYSYHPTCQQSYESRLIAEGKQPLCVMCRQPLPNHYEITIQPINRVYYDPNRCFYYNLIGICIIVCTVLLFIAYRLFF